MLPLRRLICAGGPAVLLTLACGDKLGLDARPGFSFDFEVLNGGSEPPTVDVTVVDRGAEIAGRFLLPVPCYTVSDTSFTIVGQDLTVAVHAGRAHQGACFDIVVNMLFTASITGLPPDRYALEVELYRDGRLHMRYGETLNVPGGP